MAEKLKFPGSEDPIRPTHVEMLNKDPRKPEVELDAEDDAAEAPAPEYKRDDIGPRVGVDVEKQQELREAVEDLKGQLDDEAEQGKTVPLIFRSKLNLQRDGLMHTFGPGVHFVPESIAYEEYRDRASNTTKKRLHWWLRHNGIKRAAVAGASNPPSTGRK